MAHASNAPHSAADYPLCLDTTSTLKPRQTLMLLRDRLREEKHELFVPEGKPRFVVLWDLLDAEHYFRPESLIKSPTEFDISSGSQPTSDLTCRFIFLHTASSRGKLCCSHELLTHVLTHHRVMPQFLDFCFEFRSTEKALTTALFRFEDQLESSIRIQHSFSLIAPEEESPQSDRWVIRRVAAYHSFDVDHSKSLWIVVKGNRVIRDRITSSAPDKAAQSRIRQQFDFALRTHLLILEWCVENWARYIEHLEDRGRKHAAAVKLAPVEALSRKTPRPSSAPTRGPPPRRASTGISARPPGIGGRIRTNLSRMTSGFSSHQPTQQPSTTTGIPLAGVPATSGVADEERLDKVFTFDDLQKMRHVTDEAEQAVMILAEDRRIVSTLRERYARLASTKVLPSEPAVLDFCQQLSVIEGELDSRAGRVQMLLRGMERNEEMFQGILQYGNMRVGEYYARSAERSARTMEDWTERMHDIAAETEHETVSMHGITVLTMIFLPGTFVSTLFSSGIWSFDDSKSLEMGDWETRVPALKLFFAICVPLMALVLLTWGATYWLARRHHRLAGTSDLKTGSS